MATKKKDVDVEKGGLATAETRQKFLRGVKNDLKDEYVFLEEDGSIEDVTTFVPSGCSALDYIMTNRKDGGYPVGKIVEVTGMPGTGKTLVAIHACAEAQKMGALCIYLDPENAFQDDFAKRVGLDITAPSFLRPSPPPPTIEALFSFLFSISSQIDEMKKAGEWPFTFVFIVWDSVASTPPHEELEKTNPDPTATVGLVPRVISKNLKTFLTTMSKKDICLFCLNQLRNNIKAMPGQDPYVAPGGNAIPFYASIRLRLKSIGRLKDKDGEVLGIETEVEVKKTRFGPPFRKTTFPIYFTHGIDDPQSILDVIEKKEAMKTINRGKLGKFIKFKDQADEEAIKIVEFKRKFLTDDVFRKKVMEIFEKAMTRDMSDPRLLELEVVKEG